MHIESSFKFHPVGFGLFTSGKIENFRFVYDCGTKSKKEFIENAIDSEFQTGDVIDLLAISHFHTDHISGIKKLLETVDQVKTIVLPYFTPADRLIYILSMDDTTSDTAANGDSDWLLQFITDPVSYLLTNFGDIIDNIVLISGSGDKFDNESDSRGNKNIGNSSDIYSVDPTKLPDSENEDVIKRNEDIIDSKVLIKKHGALQLKGRGAVPIWQFIFYYPKLSKKQKNYFKGILASAGINSDELVTKNKLLDILNNGDLVNNAKSNGVVNNINDTSLLLYHSPICLNNPHRRFFEIYFKEFHCHQLCNLNKEFFGFLYTGDINLKTHYADIRAYYETLLDHVGIYQIPHHGSIDNWEKSISNRNPYSIHIASSDTTYVGNLHPNPIVLLDIAREKGLFLWCNELNPIEFHGSLWIHG